MLLGLLSAEPATAHVDIRPGLVELGEVTELHVELPRLRPGAPPQALVVEGDGLEMLSSRSQGTLGQESLWTVRVRADGEPRAVPIVLRASYADGASVEVDERLTVVPAAESSFPWAGVLAGSALAVGFAVAALTLARRRPA